MAKKIMHRTKTIDQIDVDEVSMVRPGKDNAILSDGINYCGTLGLKSQGQFFRDPAALSMGGIWGGGIPIETKSILPYAKNAEMYFKASTSTESGSGTAAPSIWSPIDFDLTAVDLSLKWTPVYNMIPKETWASTVIPLDRVTAKGAGSMIAEDEAYNEVDDTSYQKAFYMKYYAIKKRITWQAEDTQRAFNILGANMTGDGVNTATVGTVNAADPRRRQLTLANRALDELLEAQVLKGSGYGVNMLGILSQVCNYANSSNTGTSVEQDSNITPNITNNAGTTALSFAQINTMLKNASEDGGRPDLMICDFTTYADIKNLMNDKYIGNIPNISMPWGSRYVSYEGFGNEIPIIPSLYADVKYCTAGSTGTESGKNLFALQFGMGNIVDKVLRARTYLELAQTSTSKIFTMYGGEQPFVRNPQACAGIVDIKA